MASHQQANTTGAAGPVRASLTAARASSTISLLAGIWFFISPWVYGSYTRAVGFNNWFAGALIIIFSVTRLMRPAYSTAMCWANMVMGIWVFCSPWIYGYANTNAALFINSLVVGFVLFVFSVISWRISVRRIPPTGAPLPRT
jgi:hypothetical protein